MLTVSGSYAISSIVSNGGKDALRKTAYLPHRTCVGASLNVSDESLHSPQSLLNKVPDQFGALFNTKNASERDAKNITPPSIGQVEKRTSSRATDFV